MPKISKAPQNTQFAKDVGKALVQRRCGSPSYRAPLWHTGLRLGKWQGRRQAAVSGVSTFKRRPIYRELRLRI
jgi:hypothetical protein